jgi:hypothetical protein
MPRTFEERRQPLNRRLSNGVLGLDTETLDALDFETASLKVLDVAALMGEAALPQ